MINPGLKIEEAEIFLTFDFILMYLPTTHAVFGILGAGIVNTTLNYKVVLWGMLFGIFPDIDYIYHLARRGIRPAKYSHEHRQAITHSLLPHFVATIILFFLWDAPGASIYLSAVIIHLILDSVHPPWGIRWLWPFSGKFYSFDFKSGFVAVTKKELDSFTATKPNIDWLKSFARLKNFYFIFEVLASLSFIGFLIYFLFDFKL